MPPAFNLSQDQTLQLIAEAPTVETAGQFQVETGKTSDASNIPPEERRLGDAWSTSTGNIPIATNRLVGGVFLRVSPDGAGEHLTRNAGL